MPLAFRSHVSIECSKVMLEELDGKVDTLTNKLYEEGNDKATVDKILQEKEAAEARISSLYEEVRSPVNVVVHLRVLVHLSGDSRSFYFFF